MADNLHKTTQRNGGKSISLSLHRSLDVQFPSECALTNSYHSIFYISFHFHMYTGHYAQFSRHVQMVLGVQKIHLKNHIPEETCHPLYLMKTHLSARQTHHNEYHWLRKHNIMILWVQIGIIIIVIVNYLFHQWNPFSGNKFTKPIGNTRNRCKVIFFLFK